MTSKNYDMITKVIVFGGSGMVGTNMQISKKNQCFKIQYPKTSEVNLLNKISVKKYLEIQTPDIIINLAGKVGGIVANKNDNFGFLEENIYINLNLITVSKEIGIKNFLNVSSSCVYPKDIQGLIKESDLLSSKLEPTNEGYSLAKIVSLKLCEFISNKSLNYKTIIPCNLYGPNDKFGENSHMIPGVINRMHHAKIKGLKSLEMWGDGTVKREFMYVQDLIEFIFYSLNNFNLLPNTMNVGWGQDYKISHYYNEIKKVIKYNGEIIINLDHPVGMNRKCVDVTEQKKIGWSPKIKLNEGIKKTYKYFLENEI